MYLYIFYAFLLLFTVTGCQESDTDQVENLKIDCLNRLENGLKKKYSFKTEELFFVEKTGTPLIRLLRFDLYVPKKIKTLDESRAITVGFITDVIDFVNDCPEIQAYLIEKSFNAEHLVIGIDYDSHYPRGEAGFVGSNMIDGTIYNTWEYKPGLYPPESYEEAKQKVEDSKKTQATK